MQSEYILKADLLDIIFEQRNKSYGAYPLRKFYHERVYKALGIIFVFITILSIYILTQQKPSVYVIPDIVTSAFVIPPPLPKKSPQVPVPKKPTTQTPAKKTDTQKWVSNIVKVDDTLQVAKLVNLKDSIAIGNSTIIGVGKVKPILDPPPVPGVPGGGVEKSKPIDKFIPLHAAEVMPAYPGGVDALRKFLERNLRNPRDLEEGEEISVKIRFVVGFDGLLKQLEIIENGGLAFNDEVIRVIKKMPAWIPGKTKGENVSVYYSIPVKFISQD